MPSRAQEDKSLLVGSHVCPYQTPRCSESPAFSSDFLAPPTLFPSPIMKESQTEGGWRSFLGFAFPGYPELDQELAPTTACARRSSLLTVSFAVHWKRLCRCVSHYLFIPR